MNIEETIKKSYKKLSDRELAEQLGLTRSQVRWKRRNLGLYRNHTQWKKMQAEGVKMFAQAKEIEEA